MTQSVSSKSIQSLAASKVTGALPAIDGSALTGISAGVYNNASDPTITSNRDLGTLWANSVSGNLFLCTDATTDANIWINVGSGSGDVAPIGYGFTAGGEQQVGPRLNSIERFSFSSGVSGTDWGDLVISNSFGSGTRSSTHGYTHGGSGLGPTSNAHISKFAASSQSNATDVGELSGSGKDACGGNYSTTHGYATGGRNGPAVPDREIMKYSYASDGNSTDAGDLITGRYQLSQGSNSSTHGFVMGGLDSSHAKFNGVEKFLFSNESTTSDHGDLTVAKDTHTSSSSSTHGFAMGGRNSSNTILANIDKFAFASNTTATGHGNLETAVRSACCSYSLTETVVVQGQSAAAKETKKQKFAFASNTTATDIGDISHGAVTSMYGTGLGFS